MQTTKKLERVLLDLVSLLEEEAGRNPEFAARLEALVAPLPAREGRRRGKSDRMKLGPIPDVFAQFQEKGEQEFRFWLRDFDLLTLKSIVKKNGFDAARVSQRWSEPDKFINLICDQIIARLERGTSFLGGQA